MEKEGKEISTEFRELVKEFEEGRKELPAWFHWIGVGVGICILVQLPFTVMGGIKLIGMLGGVLAGVFGSIVGFGVVWNSARALRRRKEGKKS